MSLRREKILIVEDSPTLAQTYSAFLADEDWDIATVTSGEAALEHISASPPDAVLLDLKLPDMNGSQVLKRIFQNNIPCSVVVVTAHGSVDLAVEAMRDGAFDFLGKPFSKERLIYTIRGALEQAKVAPIVFQPAEGKQWENFCGFIGGSPQMQDVYRIIEGAAPSKAAIFVTGESGTGKRARGRKRSTV